MAVTNWVVRGGELTNPNFIPMPEKPLAHPAPVSCWRCDPLVDAGLPFVPLFPDWIKLDIHPVAQYDYIHVFDHAAKDFEGNGLAILCPTSCEITEQLNGMWSLQMEHPVDEYGKSAFLIEENFIKAMGQVFKIKSTDERYDGASGTVTVYAEHIFYQIGDGWIFALYDQPTEAWFKSCGELLDFLRSRNASEALPGGVDYAARMTYDTNLAYGDAGYYFMTSEGCTFIDALLGDDGVIVQKGGKLYRDNLYFAIVDPELPPDPEDPLTLLFKRNAFDIRVGKNLQGINRRYDTSCMVTYLVVTDRDTGTGIAVAWDAQSPGIVQPLSHHIKRAVWVSFPENTAWRYGLLEQYTMKLFNQHCRPQLGYEINLHDVRKNPDFEITASEQIRVGNSGTLYDARIGGNITLDITETVYDAIRGECLRLTVGDKQSFVSHSIPAMHIDGIEPTIRGTEIWMQDSTGRYLYDSTGRKIVVRSGDPIN
jgi:hypothetical protein